MSFCVFVNKFVTNIYILNLSISKNMYICSTQKQKSNDDHSINGSGIAEGGS